MEPLPAVIPLTILHAVILYAQTTTLGHSVGNSDLTVLLCRRSVTPQIGLSVCILTHHCSWPLYTCINWCCFTLSGSSFEVKCVMLHCTVTVWLLFMLCRSTVMGQFIIGRYCLGHAYMSPRLHDSCRQQQQQRVETNTAVSDRQITTLSGRLMLHSHCIPNCTEQLC